MIFSSESLIQYWRLGTIFLKIMKVAFTKIWRIFKTICERRRSKLLLSLEHLSRNLLNLHEIKILVIFQYKIEIHFYLIYSHKLFIFFNAQFFFTIIHLFHYIYLFSPNICFHFSTSSSDFPSEEST